MDGITDSMDVSLGKTLGVGDGQGGLVCCSPWGHKQSDMTVWLNNNNNIKNFYNSTTTIKKEKNPKNPNNQKHF